eukprot:m.180398 g.180398  ORF g.180398 m.180398 type:complete len:104 (+) comp15498_c2_seq3:4901-5212(+)
MTGSACLYGAREIAYVLREKQLVKVVLMIVNVVAMLVLAMVTMITFTVVLVLGVMILLGMGIIFVQVFQDIRLAMLLGNVTQVLAPLLAINLYLFTIFTLNNG